MKPSASRLLQRSALAAAIAGISAPASASFFALAEQNGSGLGTAFAGGAAIAEDASTVWYNPAGMTRFDRPQLVVAASYIDLNIKTNVVSASTVAAGALPSFPINGGAGKAPGQNAVVPSLYYVHPLSKDFAVGAGINAPFGLTTEYDSTWAGRYHAVKSDIKTINFNVGGAYKINDVWSAGAGVNYQKLHAELSQAVDFATLCNLAGAGGVCGGAGATNDGFAKVTADSNAWGYNLGLLAQLPNDFRVGLAYRSSMKQSLSGNFDITVPANVPPGVTGAFGLANSGAKTDVTLPASISVSFYQQIDKWALMADITKTNWSSLQELRIKFDSTQPNSVVTLNLQDSYRFSVGATYKLSDAWTLRGGLALDQTPVTSAANTTPRLPDADRTWYAIGAGWQMSRSLAFDFGYVLIKVDDAQVRKVATPTNENVSRGNLSVDYSGSSIQVISAQARYTF
jgi:long-chain fatty acid transport protein